MQEKSHVPSNPTVGILIATYNSTAYLNEALNSISSQTRLPDQVIVVDDCSTDGTRDLVKAWADRQTFEVIQRTNPERGGIPAYGRDLGLRIASTDLLALLDHDDLMLPANLDRLRSAFEMEPGLVLAFSDALEFRTYPSDGESFFHGKQINSLPTRASSSGFRIITQGVYESLLVGSYIPTMTCMWSRKAAIDAGGFWPDAGTADDGHLWMRLALTGLIGYFPETLGCKRTHGENLSHPRNALKSCRYLRASILDILHNSDRWNLSEEARRLSVARVRDLEGQMRYHATHQGYATYREVLRQIGDESFRPKEVLASILRGLAPRR